RSPKTAMVGANCSFTQVADQVQVLLPHAPANPPPVESKNSAICPADRSPAPRGNIDIARLPRPLLFSSSAVNPPSPYLRIETSGDGRRFTSRTVPFSSTVRTTFASAIGAVGWVDSGVEGRTRSVARANPPAPT